MALSADSLCSKSTLTTSWDVLKWLFQWENHRTKYIRDFPASHIWVQRLCTLTIFNLATRRRCFQGMDWLLRTPPTHRFWPEKRTGHGATPSLSMSRWSLGLWKIISSALLGPCVRKGGEDYQSTSSDMRNRILVFGIEFCIHLHSYLGYIVLLGRCS